MTRTATLSIHGSNRLKERVQNKNRDLSFLKTVIKNGTNKKDYVGDLFKYLQNKEISKNIRAKIYKDNVYIIGSKNNHRLITTYPLPERYLPISNYELDSKSKNIVRLISNKKSTNIRVKTNDLEVYGEPIFLNTKPDNSFEIIDCEDYDSFTIYTSDVIELEIDSETYNF